MPTFEDRVLDWRPRHDPRSLSFAAVDTLDPGVTEPAYRWWPVGNGVLDQGNEGACVGHGVANAASSRPNLNSFRRPQAAAFGIYHLARFLDEWEGQAYEGTSVLAGCSVARDLGMCGQFLWAFGIDDVRQTLKLKGPVVIGIPWLDTMFRPDPDGVIDCTGKVVGGHCILLTGTGVRSDLHRPPVEVYRIRNSWGPGWGVGGNGIITAADLDARLRDGGEAAHLAL